MLLLTGFVLYSAIAFAQTPAAGGAMVSSRLGLGVRAGISLAKVSGTDDSIRYHYKPGWTIAFFLAPPTRGIVGYRTELLYSQQGFAYTDGKGNTGNASNDYVMMPHMMTINITKFVQVQAGAYAGYLLRAKNSNTTTGNVSASNDYLDILNRFDYGAGAGLEIHPFKGLVINGRYNMGFAKLYKEQAPFITTTPENPLSAFGNIDTRNAVIQLSLGYQF